MIFEWDEGNRSKIIKRFPLEEVEEFFYQELLVLQDHNHSHNELRFFAVGLHQNSRPMWVCFTLRKNKIRVISARYMHKKELMAYEKFKKENKN
ncbi:MAG: BrnT family toxin [Bacteriovoracaceae bacterium]